MYAIEIVLTICHQCLKLVKSSYDASKYIRSNVGGSTILIYIRLLSTAQYIDMCSKQLKSRLQLAKQERDRQADEQCQMAYFEMKACFTA